MIIIADSSGITPVAESEPGASSHNFLKYNWPKALGKQRVKVFSSCLHSGLLKTSLCVPKSHQYFHVPRNWAEVEEAVIWFLSSQPELVPGAHVAEY